MLDDVRIGAIFHVATSTSKDPAHRIGLTLKLVVVDIFEFATADREEIASEISSEGLDDRSGDHVLRWVAEEGMKVLMLQLDVRLDQLDHGHERKLLEHVGASRQWTCLSQTERLLLDEGVPLIDDRFTLSSPLLVLQLLAFRLELSGVRCLDLFFELLQHRRGQRVR